MNDTRLWDRLWKIERDVSIISQRIDHIEEIWSLQPSFWKNLSNSTKIKSKSPPTKLLGTSSETSEKYASSKEKETFWLQETSSIPKISVESTSAFSTVYGNEAKSTIASNAMEFRMQSNTSAVGSFTSRPQCDISNKTHELGSDVSNVISKIILPTKTEGTIEACQNDEKRIYLYDKLERGTEVKLQSKGECAYNWTDQHESALEIAANPVNPPAKKLRVKPFAHTSLGNDNLLLQQPILAPLTQTVHQSIQDDLTAETELWKTFPVKEYYCSLGATPNYKGLKCTKCDTTFQGKKIANHSREMYKHIVKSHLIGQINIDMEINIDMVKYYDLNKQMYRCATKNCFFVTKTVDKLIEHWRITGGNSHNYLDQYFRLEDIEVLYREKGTRTEDKRPVLSCGYCRYITKTEGELIKHNEDYHSQSYDLNDWRRYVLHKL